MTDIPTVDTHRGVAIHDFQPRQRIDAVVKPAIDAVYLLIDPRVLADYAEDSRNPPEARLFAAAKCQAAFAMSAHERTARPSVDMVRLKAVVAGLSSLEWMHPYRYTSNLDPHPDRAARRERPLPDAG